MDTFDFQNCLPLSRQETFFKALIMQSGSQILILGNTHPVIKRLSEVNAVFSEQTLSENSFIPQDYDAAVMRHNRYTPAISHSHDFIEVIYVLHGSCTNYISTAPIDLKQGDICIIGRHTPHALGVFSDNCVSCNLMIRSSSFEKIFLGILPEQDILSSFLKKGLYGRSANSYLIFPTGTDARILDSFNTIYREYQKKQPYTRYMMNSLISTLFILLLRHYGALARISDPSGKSVGSKEISAILYYIQNHYENITLKKLSELFHYSERHIGRLIKEYTGLSFTGLLHQIRLNQAARLLTDSALPVSDIISSVGYADYGFFYRIFKQTFHVTPAEYRKHSLQ